MLRHRGLVLCLRQEPVARTVRVGQRFLRGEGFRGDDEKRGLGGKLAQRLGDVSAIDVGNEMGARALAAIGLQRLGHHDGAEIRAADADVHDIRDRLARVALPRAGTHRVREFLHVREHRVHFRHHVLAIDQDRRIRPVAQCDMQHRAVLGEIDLFAGKHLLRHARHVALDRQRAQQLHRLADDAVLGKIEKYPFKFQREFLRAVGVHGEEIAHLQRLGGLVVLLEVQPGGRRGERAHKRRNYGRKRAMG